MAGELRTLGPPASARKRSRRARTAKRLSVPPNTPSKLCERGAGPPAFRQGGLGPTNGRPRPRFNLCAFGASARPRVSASARAACVGAWARGPVGACVGHISTITVAAAPARTGRRPSHRPGRAGPGPGRPGPRAGCVLPLTDSARCWSAGWSPAALYGEVVSFSG